MRHLLALLLLAAPALAGSGTLTISTVSGSSPGPYTLVMTSSPASVTVGDDLGAKLSSGRGALYTVGSVNAGTLTVVVYDNRYHSETTYYGPPATGSCWYATPVPSNGALDSRQPQPPHGAVGWDAPLRLGLAIVASNTAVIAAASPSAVSSGTGAYATSTSFYIPPETFMREGAMVRITANIRQNGGAGLFAQLEVAGNSVGEKTTAGVTEWIIVREAGSSIAVYGGAARATIAGLNFNQGFLVNVQLKGNGANDSTVLDFVVAERLR